MSSKRKSNGGSVVAAGDLEDPAAKRRKLPSVSNYLCVVALSALVAKSWVESLGGLSAISGAGLVAGLAIQSAHRNTYPTLLDLALCDLPRCEQRVMRATDNEADSLPSRTASIPRSRKRQRRRHNMG